MKKKVYKITLYVIDTPEEEEYYEIQDIVKDIKRAIKNFTFFDGLKVEYYDEIEFIGEEE